MNKDIPKIPISNDDFGLVLNCAVRYALGRQTYVPKAIIDFTTPLLPYLNDKTLGCFRSDITYHEVHGSLGNPLIDVPHWLEFKESVISEIGRRKENKIDVL